MSVCNRYIERFCKMKPENLFFYFFLYMAYLISRTEFPPTPSPLCFCLKYYSPTSISMNCRHTSSSLSLLLLNRYSITFSRPEDTHALHRLLFHSHDVKEMKRLHWMAWLVGACVCVALFLKQRTIYQLGWMNNNKRGKTNKQIYTMDELFQQQEIFD